LLTHRHPTHLQTKPQTYENQHFANKRSKKLLHLTIVKKGVGGLNHEVKKKIQKFNIFISKIKHYVKRNKRTYRQI